MSISYGGCREFEKLLFESPTIQFDNNLYDIDKIEHKIIQNPYSPIEQITVDASRLMTNVFDNAEAKGLSFVRPDHKKDPFGIKKVLFNGPATIVWFDDGQKVIVKKTKKDKDNRYVAIMYAVMKHAYGNNSQVHKQLDKFVKEAEPKK